MRRGLGLAMTHPDQNWSTARHFPLPALAKAFLMMSRIAPSSSIHAGSSQRNLAPFTRRAHSLTFSLEISSRKESLKPPVL